MTVSSTQGAPVRGQAGIASLMEILVVSALVVILMVVFGTYSSAGARRKEFAACRNNLQKIYLAVSLYQNDHNGAYPGWKDATNPAQPLSLLVPKCTTMTEIFICPGSDDPPLAETMSFATQKISYAYYMGWTSNDDGGAIIASDAQVDAAPKNQGQQLFSGNGKPPGNNHGKEGGNLLSRAGDVAGSGPKAARAVRYPPAVHLLNPP